MASTDHWDLIERTLAGETLERPPVSLWRHFPEDDLDAGTLCKLTLSWQEKWNFDLVKLMPRGTYGIEDWGAQTAYRGSPLGGRVTIRSPIQKVEDWSSLQQLNVRVGVYGDQNGVLENVARSLRGRVPVIQTIFSPLTTAMKLAGERIFSDMKEAPDSVMAALSVIADVTLRFAEDALSRGAHGFFFATQLASHQCMDEASYRKFGSSFDLAILDALRQRSRINILHAHGDDLMLDMLTEYPVNVFNWHDRMCGPSLTAMAQRFKGVLAGGVHERVTLAKGDAIEIANEAKDSMDQTAARRLLLAPGCVLPVNTSEKSIQALIDAVGAIEYSI